MFADADHEVIDSPEALFRHLYEEHGVEEARDLDPETAPLQFWLRRHADLERAERAARRRPDPEPERPAQEPPEPARQPAPRSQAEPRSRAEPRSQAEPRSEAEPRSRAEPRSPAEPRRDPPSSSRPPGGRGPGRPDGGSTVREGRGRARFGDPLVEAMARALAGRGFEEAAVRSAIRSFRNGQGPSGEAAVRAALVEPMLQSAAEHLLGAPSAPRPPDHPQPAPARPSASPASRPAAEPDPAPARPEAAWAVLWADLADSGRRPGDGGESGGEDGDDLMAVANAVQARRRVRLLRR